MIVGSILDNNGVAITFGLVTAAAALGLILVTMVVPAEAFHRPEGDRFAGADDRRAPADKDAGSEDDERAGARIEEQVDVLVAAGADEREVRELVRRVMAFARRPGISR